MQSSEFRNEWESSVLLMGREIMIPLMFTVCGWNTSNILSDFKTMLLIREYLLLCPTSYHHAHAL